MQNFPQRKLGRWKESQGSNSGISNDVMTEGVSPDVVRSVATGTTGNGNPASMAVSSSSTSSGTTGMVKSLVKTQDGIDKDRQPVVEYVTKTA
eukprot:8394789-Heterocapsa_arctica.AAC.1